MTPLRTQSAVAHDCPDCLSDTNILHLGGNIHVIQISHDDHCPTFARIEAKQ